LPVRLDARVRDLAWVALDLEMTGLDPEHDRICEVGLVRGRGSVVEERWTTLVDPGRPVPDEVRKVHGLGAAELAGAPAFAAVAPEIVARLGGAVPIAHSVGTDRAFLHAELGRAGLALIDRPWIDTLEIARRLLLLPRHRLGDVCRAFGVPLGRAHRALDDADATFAVFGRMLEVLDPDGELTVGDLVGVVDDLAAGSAWRERQWRTLRRAFEDRRRVRIEYVSRDEDDRIVLTTREVEIWKLAPPRFEGFCHLRGAHRVFRLERTRRVEDSDVAYEIPAFKARL
jgi:DNA polymerase III epsilon subunit-like protein